MSQKDDSRWPNFGRTVLNVISPTVILFGALGNIMVIMVIFKTKNMRNSTNIFLANLAVADLMTLLMLGGETWFNLNSGLNIKDLSKGICKAVPFIEATVFNASVMIIIAIGFDRYYAVCQPLKAKYICTNKRAYRISILVWALATLSSSLNLVWYSLGKYNVSGIYYGPVCMLQLDFIWVKIYSIIRTLVLFFLPLIILLVIFSIMACHLKRSSASHVNTAAIRHRNHVIKMLATVVLLFFVCQLPYRLYILIFFSWPLVLMKLGRERTNTYLFVCNILVVLHSAVNPILYNLMSKRFREGFRNICFNMFHGLSTWRSRCCLRKRDAYMTTTSINTSSV